MSAREEFRAALARYARAVRRRAGMGAPPDLDDGAALWAYNHRRQDLDREVDLAGTAGASAERHLRATLRPRHGRPMHQLGLFCATGLHLPDWNLHWASGRGYGYQCGACGVWWAPPLQTHAARHTARGAWRASEVAA